MAELADFSESAEEEERECKVKLYADESFLEIVNGIHALFELVDDAGALAPLVTLLGHPAMRPTRWPSRRLRPLPNWIAAQMPCASMSLQQAPWCRSGGKGPDGIA